MLHFYCYRIIFASIFNSRIWRLTDFLKGNETRYVTIFGGWFIKIRMTRIITFHEKATMTTVVFVRTYAEEFIVAPRGRIGGKKKKLLFWNQGNSAVSSMCAAVSHRLIISQNLFQNTLPLECYLRYLCCCNTESVCRLFFFKCNKKPRPFCSFLVVSDSSSILRVYVNEQLIQPIDNT